MPGDRKLWASPVDIPYFSSSFQVSPAVGSPSDGHASGPRPNGGSPPAEGQWYGKNGLGAGVVGADDDTDAITAPAPPKFPPLEQKPDNAHRLLHDASSHHEMGGEGDGHSDHDSKGSRGSKRRPGRVAPGVHGGGGVDYGPDTAQNIFFYGERLTRRDGSVDGSYQADALSANTAVNATHFEEMHTYRLEWEPGPGPVDRDATDAGYMRWCVGRDVAVC